MEQALFAKGKLMPDRRISNYFKWFGTMAMVVGVILPFMFILRVIEVSMFLVFLTHISSVLGVITASIGFLGFADDIFRTRY